MPILINLTEVREAPLELRGELAAAELRLGIEDELLHFRHPLEYGFTVEYLGDALLVAGECRLPVDCECARCLKPFPYTIHLPGWSAHLALTGPEKVSPTGDLVDLTPQLREDIVLALPHHPVCGTGCGGPKKTPHDNESNRGQNPPDLSSGAWAALDKLKL